MCVELVIDFTIPEGLSELYAESSDCQYVGSNDGAMDAETALTNLERYATTKKYGAFERIGIMKIYKDGVLVGFSLPRDIKEKEHKVFLLPENTQWYRIGTVYIGKAYRGRGIMRDAIKKFKELYPNLLWTCNETNIGSRMSALSGGLIMSHHIYVGENKYWEHKPFDGMIRTDLVFKSEV